ncbi:thiamine ABC transporter substrate-binding protein [Nocardioides sp. TRM66260-LWL]|uniref:thiamine ABC transporter substrate-binding protein n=1 Tax=Nocardioides sp. TRM66260-LWL TaxID=2874478 RepID=UPI001CC3F560|nr:thiamine ABC transporter substrate-binding protein [Nocardioides sp. TRM66260-LWL]MBZ5734835.1 thiamine ABC transporter substrate-binding protein [Nocardioides sp. TRM66260-LWL]
MTRARPTSLTTLAAGLLALSALAGCSLGGPGTEEASGSDGAAPTKVVLVTHDSFSLPKALIAQFEKDTGYDLQVRSSGDAGTLTSQLVLNADDPVADVAYGVDNTFGSRALQAQVFTPVDVTEPAGAAAYDLPGDDAHALRPVDQGNVCVNVDDTWFAAKGLTPPRTFDDLLDPRYRGLLVTPGATTSSPGLAFLLATIARYGEDGWQDYWRRLLANGTKVVSGWSDAYEVDFTQGGGKGRRPIVVSYDSSPAFTVDGKGGTTTSALLDTCFQQVEYVGALRGAANEAGAKAVVAWLQSPEVQAALPESMYVFPVAEGTALPKDWARFAKQPASPASVAPERIAEQRDTWLRQWSDLVGS